MKSKALRRIERISYFLLVASILAILLGCYTAGKGVGALFAADGNLSRYETSENVTLIIEGLVLIIHYYFVARFFITDLKEGVPLTIEGAKELRTLGWETIVLPLVVMIIRLFLFNGLIPLENLIEIEVYETILGIFIVQTSYVIEYATEKIESGHRYHLMCQKLKMRYPDIYEEVYIDTSKKNEKE